MLKVISVRPMSWVRSIPISGDDVFNEEGDDLNLPSKEWMSNMEKRVKEGYRDGVDAGKEASLQRGFNAGYREEATKMVAVGQLKGIVSAMQCWCQLRQLSSPSVTQLLQDVVKYEEMVVKRLEMVEVQPLASVQDVTDHIEDLVVRGADCPPWRENCAMMDCCMEEGNSSSTSQTPCKPTCSTSSMEQRLEELLKACLHLVTELGLPEELSHHIKQLMST